MSDSPRTTLSHWQELQKTKCELAAAKVRIAELERERNYLVNVLYKAREDCMEDNDCCAWLLLNQTCARYPATGKET